MDKIRLLENSLKDQEDKLTSASQLSTVDQLPNLNDNQQENKMSDLSSHSLKLGKRDNILEFCVDKAVFDSSSYEEEKTFVSWMMPFTVDDPLQHTNLAIGSLANYNHTSLYKLKMNGKTLSALQEVVPGKFELILNLIL